MAYENGNARLIRGIPVSNTLPTNGQAPIYNSSTGQYEPTTPSGGSGDVTKVGTPVDNQIGVWTGDGTIEGTSGLTYDGANLQLTGDIGSTGSRITKGWFTDLTVTNVIAGSVTGNAGTVTNGVYTTDAGTVFLAPSGNGSSLTGLTTSQVTESTDLNYVSDAQLVVIGNTSGTNTGDQNIFASVAVSGQTTVTTASTSQALTLVAGTNVTITTDNTAKSVTINASGGGLSWGSSINGATGTGLALAMDNSYAASGIGQSITIGNTQTQALTAFKLDTGTSTGLRHSAFLLDSRNVQGNLNVGEDGALRLNSFGTDTQPLVNNATTINLGSKYGTNSSNRVFHIYLTNEQNAGAGVNTGISIDNKSTELTIGSASGYTNFSIGAGISMVQSGAGGTSIVVTGANNVNSSTNGLVNYTLSNTQSGATVMQKIDTGTSAQGHTGLLVNAYNASTSLRGVKVDGSSTATGSLLELTSTNTGGNLNMILGTSNSSSSFLDFISFIGPSSTEVLKYNFVGARNEMNVIIGNANTSYYLNTAFQVAGGATAATLTARTNNFTQIIDARNHNAATSVSDNYVTQSIRRSNIVNNAGGALTAAGSVLKLENIATQTAGALTDSVNILSIVQDVDSTGVPISITQNAVVSTNYRKLITETATGITIWMGNGTTANGTLSGTAGDILINGGSNKPEYCTGTTNWTALV